MRRLRSCLAVLTLVLLGASTASAAPAPYEINAILSLTGGGAFLGKEEQQALETLAARVNAQGGVGGRPIAFVIADDQTDPRTAVELTTRVEAKNVPVILGSSLVATCNPMIPLVKDGPVLYCFSPGIRPVAEGYVFSSGFATSDLVAVAVHYLRGRGWNKIALITSTDATGQEAERSIDDAVQLPQNAGVTIVDREHFNPTDISVSAQMTRIKGSGASALIAWSTGSPVGTVLRGITDVGLTLPVVTSNGNLTYAQMQQYAGFLPANLYFPAGPSYAPDEIADRATKRSVQNYLDAFALTNMKPDNGQSLAWDPAQLVIEALRKFGPGMTAAQLRGYLAGLQGWSGANGTYNYRAMPQRGLEAGSIVMVRWDAGKGTWVGVSKPGGTPLPKP